MSFRSQLLSPNLPAPINEGPDPQTKTGNLIIEGVLRLGQFATAPSGTEGALYFNTTDKKTKLYSNSAWGDLGGGWDGILPNYTTAQRNALSLVDGLIVYNTTENAVQIYKSDAWANVGAKLSLAATCSLDGDCDSTHCIDGVCCDTGCTGNCNRCNVAGSEGICTNTNLDCIGNCDVCSSGNCVASVALCTGDADQCTGSDTEYNCSGDASLCTGNCVQVTGSGTEYNCSANDTLCTGNCDICTSSDTAYNCAADNSQCLNNTSSCGCSGSATVFNCTSCTSDPYGVCGHPTCSSYTCGQAYDNGVYCSTCHYCSSGSCSAHYAAGYYGAGCTAAHYRCDGGGNCTAPYTETCTNLTSATCDYTCTANYGSTAICIQGWNTAGCYGTPVWCGSAWIYCFCRIYTY